MSMAQVEYGLRCLAVLAPDFQVGGLDFDDESCHLRHRGRLAAKATREVLEDLDEKPEMVERLRVGIVLARREARTPNPRLVLIETTGVRFEQ